MNIASAIRKVRESEGLSASELAQRSGLSQAYISKLEDGKYEAPSIKTCRALAEGLGLTLRDFLDKIGVLDNSHNTTGTQLIGSALRSNGYNEDQVKMLLEYADFIKRNTKTK